MDVGGDVRDGICILSFDSGGPGTYSQLLILKEYMSRLSNDLGVTEDDVYPANYFDLIGGVGFGGLAAFILGHLQMNVNGAIDALISVVSTIFLDGSFKEASPATNSGKLRKSVEGVLLANGVPLDMKMNDKRLASNKCKVALYAATSVNINHPHTFRTYPSRGSSLNPTIIEALCATISVSSYFSPVKIGPRLREENFIGGAFGANNPTRELLKEAAAIYGNDRRAAQIISIGSGLPRVPSLDSLINDAEVGRLLSDMATDSEAVARDLAARLGNIDAYLRISVNRGLEDLTMQDWDKLGSIAGHTRIYVESPRITDALDSSLRRIQERIGVITLGQLSTAITPLKGFQPLTDSIPATSNTVKVTAKMAPAVSPYFVLRNKVWEIMVQHLVASPFPRQRIFSITGMGGCGKTQLVSYFLQQYSNLYTYIVFVNATSLASIRSDIQTWVRSLGNGHETDVWEDGLVLLTGGLRNAPWALIMDNADDPQLDLVPFIPQNINGTVIITSRNRELGNLATTYDLELGRMEVEEALSALKQAARRQLPLSGYELQQARVLIMELGCLAVALVQAGTYCHQLSSKAKPYTFTQYLSLFYSHRKDLMSKAEPSSLDSYQKGIYTTLDISYRALPPTARDFLHFITFFHPTDIPITVLATAARASFVDPWSLLARPREHTKVFEDLENLLCVDGKWSELRVQEMIRTLRSFSLLSATSVDDRLFLQIHPLTYAWSRDMVPSSSQHYAALVIQVITACVSGDNYPLHRYLLPSILDLLGGRSIHTLHINDLVSFGRILNEHGHHRNATILFEVALTILRRVPQQEEENTLAVLLWLGLTYSQEGRWSDAERLESEVLERRRTRLGDDHLDTLASASNLSSTYYGQGRWGDAERLATMVLGQRKRILGTNHPDTIFAGANLASIYQAQERWEEAEALEMIILDQRNRSLGADHPLTIWAAANKGSTYQAQGNWNKAEKLQVDVLSRRKRILGEEHPDTLHAEADLAITYRSQGRFGEAEMLELQVLSWRRRILGDDHPDTMYAASNLARTVAGNGRLADAERLELRVLEQRLRILGPEHLDTISAAAALASTYQAQGQWKEAERLEEIVLELRMRLLGNDHPHTLWAAANLASSLVKQGQWAKGEVLEVDVLARRRRILGTEHPHTVTAAANLASTYYTQGRYRDAEILGSHVLGQQTRILGTEHPESIRAVANMATIYQAQGRFNEAETLGVQVLEQRRKLLGNEHPDTLLAAANLAATYGSQNRWEDDVRLLAPVAQLSINIKGLEHPDTKGCILHLLFVYEILGWDDAAQEMKGLLRP